MSEAVKEHAKKLRNLAASHSYQEALLAGAEALEHLASRPNQGAVERLVDAFCAAPRGDLSLLVRFVQAIERLSADSASLASGVQRVAEAQWAALESQTKSSPKVLHEAWSIVGTTGNLAGVQSGTPLLFFATQEEATEAAKFRPRPFRAIRVQIVEVPS